jgi:hypothetical protein
LNSQIEEQDDLIRVFPSPTQDKVFIELTASQHSGVVIQLMNILGRVCVESEIISGSRKELDISGLQPGYYLVRVLVSDQLIGEEKLIVQ